LAEATAAKRGAVNPVTLTNRYNARHGIKPLSIIGRHQQKIVLGTGKVNRIQTIAL
jgi:hypothetical protein|tara:strand:- start:316 stop:483 length:168 start_codon:yes stop_codon:yes gene_type:complete